VQTYANHAHRPVLWAVGFLFWMAASAGFAGWLLERSWGMAALLGGLLGVSGVVLTIGRVYVTRLQDRIILLEMQVRGASLLSPAQRQHLAALPKAKVVALRFASDAELPALLERAVADDLSPDAIKRAVTQWRPDHLRT
jgi:hypothetical protein